MAATLLAAARGQECAAAAPRAVATFVYDIQTRDGARLDARAYAPAQTAATFHRAPTAADAAHAWAAATYRRCADIPKTGRRGRDAEIPRIDLAATPRPRRGSSVETRLRYAHGGCFSNGDCESFAELDKSLAARGLLVVDTSFRQGASNPHPGALYRRPGRNLALCRLAKLGSRFREDDARVPKSSTRSLSRRNEVDAGTTSATSRRRRARSRRTCREELDGNHGAFKMRLERASSWTNRVVGDHAG